MGEEETGTTNESVPKLTIGQRILASLPNLDRRRSGSERGSGPDDSAKSAEGARTQQSQGRTTSDEVIKPDEVISPGGARAGSDAPPSRLRDAFFKPPPADHAARKTDPTKNMSNEELAHAIKRIDDRERSYALFAGPLGAAAGIVLTVAAIHYNPPLHHKGHVANSITELYGVARVVLSGVVMLTALSRRRSLVAFALLLLGTAEGFPFALLFWGLGGWMIWRVFRYQKVLTARGGTRGRPADGPRAAGRAGASDARQRASARKAAPRDRGRGRKKPEPTGPPPSKRYTPPKPTRPRPTAPS